MEEKVKCKDCEHYDNYTSVCRFYNIWDKHHPDSTCNYAKKKEVITESE